MPELNLVTFSNLVSEKVHEEIVFTSIEKIGSGYHSDGFKLSTVEGRSFFLKYIKSHDLGFEFPERQVMALMVSSAMSERAGGKKNPLPIGVIVLNGNLGSIMPDLNEASEVFHLQEFGGVGKSYLETIEENIIKVAIDDGDRIQLSAIADALVKIHSTKHPSENKEQINAIYNDGIRNILIHPELSVMVLSEFPSDYPILDLEGQKELIGLMYENIKSWMGRGDRMTALHGDFWGSNIYFKEDGSPFVIDFSRIPWGDPAIDAGWFISLFLWKYHQTGNPYFKDMTEEWLQIYQEKSGDTEIRKALPLVLGWAGIVQVYPRWFPGLNVEIGKKFIAHIIKILKNKEFVWE